MGPVGIDPNALNRVEDPLLRREGIRIAPHRLFRRTTRPAGKGLQASPVTDEFNAKNIKKLDYVIIHGSYGSYVIMYPCGLESMHSHS